MHYHNLIAGSSLHLSYQISKSHPRQKQSAPPPPSPHPPPTISPHSRTLPPSLRKNRQSINSHHPHTPNDPRQPILLPSPPSPQPPHHPSPKTPHNHPTPKPHPPEQRTHHRPRQHRNRNTPSRRPIPPRQRHRTTAPRPIALLIFQILHLQRRENNPPHHDQPNVSPGIQTLSARSHARGPGTVHRMRDGINEAPYEIVFVSAVEIVVHPRQS